MYLPHVNVAREAACDDMEFIDFCADLVCYMVPPKDVLARMFTKHRFAAPLSGWTADAAARVFEQAVWLILSRETGPTASRKKVVSLWKECPPKILGITADRKPYAWSPENWL